MLKWRTVTAAFALLLAAFVAAFSAAMAPTSANATAPLDDQAAMYRACVSRLNEAPARPLNAARRAWLQTCRDVFAPPSSSPSPSVSPTGSPSASPSPSLSPSASPSVSPTPQPTIPGPSVCPPLPAFPDEHCTGYAHTGATLRPCARVLTQPGVYDRCEFTGTLVIAADGVIVTRSWVHGGNVQGSPNQYDLRGVQLTDVEISGVVGGTDQLAAVGPNRYNCLRCHVHGGYRGFALGNDVVIVDSYAHGFRTQANAHQTAASTHGGSNVLIDHSRLRCESNKYACSNGISFYAEGSNIDNVVIQNSHISTDAGSGIGFFYLNPGNGKPYDVLNTRILNNTFGSWEYGMVANWMGDRDGNVWSGNTQAPFDPGCRC